MPCSLSTLEALRLTVVGSLGKLSRSLHRHLLGLRRSSFAKAVAVLAGGSALAQALSLAVLPLATRLYEPSDFSALAVFTSLVSITSAVAGLRLELAIPVADGDEEAANILALALTSSTLVAATTASIALYFGVPLAELGEHPALSAHLWLIPIGVCVASWYNALHYWSTRQRRFSEIAQTRIAQAVGGAGTQLGLGWFGVAPAGLMYGQVVMSGAGVIRLGLKAWREERVALRKVAPRQMLQALSKHSRYPRYSVLDALSNNIATQAPLVIIATAVAGADAGYLMIAMRIIAAPLGLIGGAVAQVYFARAPDELKSQTLPDFTIRTLEGLLKIGVGPIVFIGAVAPFAFSIVFGAEWRRAGELVAWMVPWAVLQFLSSPVSMVMHVTNRQRGLLAVTASAVPMRLGAVVIATVFAVEWIPEVYALSGGAFYLLCSVVFYRAAGVSLSSALSAIKRVGRAPLIWTAAAIAARTLLQMTGPICR